MEEMDYCIVDILPWIAAKASMTWEKFPSVGLHQSLFAEGLLDLHPRLSINIDSRLDDDLSEETAKRKTSSAFITSLEHDSQNMLAETERQANVNSIDKLSLLQYQITAPGNWPSSYLPEALHPLYLFESFLKFCHPEALSSSSFVILKLCHPEALSSWSSTFLFILLSYPP
jgi:hypothetical protein